jgi:UDP-3-O-[3-hydroxymyristoyl] glucosamine N-acyltransferase LpxD
VANVHNLARPIVSTELAAALMLSHLGPALDIVAVTSSDGAGAGRLSFGAPHSANGEGCIWITGAETRPAEGSAAIVSSRIRLDFIRALHHLRASGHWPISEPGSISANARIHPTAVVHEGASIGAFCEIGPGTVVHAAVTLGERVIVGAGTVLGHDGFGYERQADDTPLHFPHLGRLIIEDDVAIGNLCSISRGTLDDTRIGHHTRIDDQVYVAHNVTIDENVLVMSGVRLNGRVHVASGCWLGTGALVREGCAIGQGATVGMGSVAVRSVEAGRVVAGNPARTLR